MYGVPSTLCYYRSCPRPCTPTHTSGDKDEVGVAHNSVNVLSTLLGRLSAYCRTAPCAEPSRCFYADVDTVLNETTTTGQGLASEWKKDKGLSEGRREEG